MNFENKSGDQIEVVLDKDSYKLGDTVNITAYTNFGFKSILTTEVGQLDSPFFDSAGYGSKQVGLDYNQYDSIFTTQYKIDNNEKRLGHYSVTVFDNLDSVTKYFKVSENGLEIIHSEPTLTLENQYVRYGETLHYNGYMDYTFDENQLRSIMFDNSRNNSENKRLVGNNVLLTIDYESDDFKIIGNENYVNMNELGYFEGEIKITRNITSDQIITITADTVSQSVSQQFVILGDDEHITYKEGEKYDCEKQIEFIDYREGEYQNILDNAKLLDGYGKKVELKRALNYITETENRFKLTAECIFHIA